MTQHNTVHVRVRCFECGKTLGHYEVTENVFLDEIPLPSDFICTECLDKQKKQTEALT